MHIQLGVAGLRGLGGIQPRTTTSFRRQRCTCMPPCMCAEGCSMHQLALVPLKNDATGAKLHAPHAMMLAAAAATRARAAAPDAATAQLRRQGRHALLLPAPYRMCCLMCKHRNSSKAPEQSGALRTAPMGTVCVSRQQGDTKSLCLNHEGWVWHTAQPPEGTPGGWSARQVCRARHWQAPRHSV